MNKYILSKIFVSILLLTTGCAEKKLSWNEEMKQYDDKVRSKVKLAITEKEKLSLVKEYPSAIKYIRNPSNEMSLIAVSSGNIYIKYIKNPSEEVQLEALKENGDLIQYIRKPTKKAQLAAVKQSGSNILYIHNPSEEAQLVAVTSSYDNTSISNIQYINNPSEKVQIAAIKYDEMALRYIKNPTEKVQLNAVDQGVTLYRIHNPTEKVQLKAINKDPSNLLAISNPTEKMQLAAIKKNGEFLQYIKKPSPNVQIMAVKSSCPDYGKILNNENMNSPKFNYTMGRAFSEQECVLSKKLKPISKYLVDNRFKANELSALWYEKAANQGYPDAQYALAIIYSEGKGVNTDYLKAAHLFEEAAKDNIYGAHLNACFNYQKAKVYTKAAECYKKETSFPAKAYNGLGVLYSTGKGVKLNKQKAYQSFMKAVENGSVEAQNNLDILCKKSSWACK